MTKRRAVAFLLAALFVSAPSLTAQQRDDVPLANWSAPPYWAAPIQAQPGTEGSEAATAEARALDTSALPTEPLPFIGITPCRLIDTRNLVGTYGGPALVGGSPRSFPVAGQCGVAANAGAISINATVTNTQGPGFVAFYPEGGGFPGISNVNYTGVWQTVANAAVVPLGPGGFTALAGVYGTDLIVDVNGYYAPEGVRSVFGRTGNVVGALGDYTASQVTNVPAGGITATDVQGALNGLDTGKAGVVHTHSGSEIAGLTPGGITFGDAAGHLAQNAGKLLWDDSVNLLRIGASSPMAWLDLNGIVLLPETTAVDGYPQTGVIFLGVESFLHNYGPSFGGWNTFLGLGAGNFTITAMNMGEGSSNTGIGYHSLHLTSRGSANTATGSSALLNNTLGSSNTATGNGTLYHNSTGGGNTAVGAGSLPANTEGHRNVAVGYSSLVANTTGDDNIALGTAAGRYLTIGNHNIDIGNQGVADEANTIRIGDVNQNRTFVAGIRGVTPGFSDGLAVIIDSSGQLGTSATVGAVTSVFGRTGAVTAQAGDYSASQVANVPAGNLAATTAQAAVDELDAEKAPLAHTHLGSDITSAVADATNAVNADTVDGLHASAFVQGETVLVVDESFDRTTSSDYSASRWNTTVSGAGSVSWNSPGLVSLSTGVGGSAILRGVKQFQLSSGALTFKSGLVTYSDSTIYGDGQPRGLANGTDRDNAIEFISQTPASVRCRTVAGGTPTDTVVSIGHSVYLWTAYEIVATSTSVRFYIDGELVATHATNIPTLPLNLFFETQDAGPDARDVRIDHVSLERRF